MTSKDKQDVISVCRILADKMSDSGQVAVQQIIDAVRDMIENEPCEDAISRAAVFEQINDWQKDEFLSVTNPLYYLHKRINSLSSVTPKQKVGKWKVYEYEHFFDYNKTESKILICSECETQFLSNREQFIEWANYNIHYCPNCGAKMEVEDENKTK